jgi:type I restriction enzyme S subunit
MAEFDDQYQFDISGGGTPSTEKDEYWEGTIPWVSSKDMKSRYIYDTIDHITPLGLQNSTCSLVDVGSIIIVVRSGILQRTIPVGINKVPLVVNQDQKVLSSRGDVLEEFFYYFVSGNEISLLTDWMKEGTTVESIEMEYLENFPLHFPPSSEQEQIVSFLDEKTSKIDDLIKKKEQKIELLKEYRTSLINRVITKGLNPDVHMKDSGVEWIGEIPSHWNIKKLKYVSHIEYGISPPDTTYNDEGIGSVLVNGPVEYSETDFGYTRSLKWTTEPKKFTDKGSLLFCLRGSTTGRMIITHDRVSIGRGVCSIISHQNQWYLIYSMFCVRDWISGQLSGSTFPSVVKEDVDNFIIPSPPLPEQEQIVSYLDQKTGEIDSTIDSEKKKIDLLKEYRQSLISSVITGNIKVVD